MFCEVECKSKHKNASEGKNMQISAEINQKKICKTVQKQTFSRLEKKLVLLKKTVKIDVSTYESVQ